MKKIRLHDKVFQQTISPGEIERNVKELARRLNEKWKDRTDIPLVLSILNGAFMFTAELMKQTDFTCEISFVKLSSYDGLDSCKKVSELIGLNTDIGGRDIIVVEDIVETGNTIETIHNLLAAHNPRSITFVTLFFKPEAYTKNIRIDHYAMKLPNDFIIGYGLDYKQLGRNLDGIYTLVNEKTK